MKFFHISDLHFGKMLHNMPLTETDQAFWVERFLEAVDEYQPEAVVIAGDIYDRRVPPVEAVRLFDRLLTGLADRGKYIFVIPGNHDSAVRLSHVNELLKTHRIYIAGELSRELIHVTVPGCFFGSMHSAGSAADPMMSEAGSGPSPGSVIPDAASETSSGSVISDVDSGLFPDPVMSGVQTGTSPEDSSPDVTFWLLPYLFPKAAADKRVLDREDLTSYDEAARALIDLQEINPDKVNVLVAHQNVLAHGVKPEHSESETIIGGIGEIDFTAFDVFDYVALGHIHNAQKVGRETVRYAGCPLYYDFSEIGRSKDLTMVTIHSKDEIRVERIRIPLLHGLLQKKGTLEELLSEGVGLKDRESWYIQCILQDKHVPPRAMEQLREVFGDSLVNVKREIRTEADADSPASSKDGSMSATPGLMEQFSQFYQEQMGELPDADQEAALMKILEQQTRRGGDYIQKISDIPEEDSQELLDLFCAGRRMTENG